MLQSCISASRLEFIVVFIGSGQIAPGLLLLLLHRRLASLHVIELILLVLILVAGDLCLGFFPFIFLRGMVRGMRDRFKILHVGL